MHLAWGDSPRWRGEDEEVRPCDDEARRCKTNDRKLGEKNGLSMESQRYHSERAVPSDMLKCRLWITLV